MVAKSIDRVPRQTRPEINDRIARETDMTIAYFTQHPEQIAARLRELDQEWDIERALETAAPSITLFGIAMSFLRGRRWILLLILVQSFFLQHALRHFRLHQVVNSSSAATAFAAVQGDKVITNHSAQHMF